MTLPRTNTKEMIKHPIYIVVGLFLFISCGNSSEGKKESAPLNSNDISSSEVEENDLFSGLEEDGWEMDEETRKGLEQLDAFLEGVESFSAEMNYELLLHKKQLSKEEFQATLETINKERIGQSKPIDPKTEAKAYAEAFQSKMRDAGIAMTLEEAEALVLAYHEKEDQKLTSKYNRIETEKEIHKVLQKNLGDRKAGFLEENLSNYQNQNNKERVQTLRKLAVSTSEKETREALKAYYGISEEELSLLEQFPKLLEKLPSEKAAIALGEYQIPKAMKTYLSSGKASSNFKTIVEKALQQKEQLSDQFLAAARKARKQFYKKNPNWIQNDESTDNTYIDERGHFVFLPLGDVSFADAIVSQKLGTAGANAEGILGPPDMSTKRFHEVDEKICNLGRKGQITLAFTDNSLANVNGPDLYVFEMGAIEPTNLEISKDGSQWIAVGQIKGGTALVDIEPFVKPGDTFNFIRLTDLETSSGIPGADIDAVAAIGGAMLLTLDSAVLFDSGSYTLKESARKELQKLVEKIKAFPSGTITINGHTDNVGKKSSNLQLSENRAASVASVIQNLLGDNYQYQIHGYGDQQPIAPNNTPENKQKNRRVELLVTPTIQ